MHAAKDCAINNLAKSRFEPLIKAGDRYHLQQDEPCSDVHDGGRNHESGQPDAQRSDHVERPRLSRPSVYGPM
jgi:hypothetical protein